MIGDYEKDRNSGITHLAVVGDRDHNFLRQFIGKTENIIKK